MSQICQNYTTVTFENIKDLLTHYDLGELKSFQPLSGGFANSNFKLTCLRGDLKANYCLKVWLENSIQYYKKNKPFFKNNNIGL